MDPGSSSPSPERVPATDVTPLRWGLGDFLWIYFAGIVASVVGASIGFAITGDTSGHVGALTTALSTFGQFGTWLACLLYIARSKGRSLRDDFGLTFQLEDWWAPFAGIGLFLVGSALIYPLVSIANANQQVVDDLRQAGGAKLAVFAVVASIVAPVCEELLFRGLLLRALRRRMSPEMAVIVQALAFALAHPMLSPTLGDFAVVPALFLLGAVSGVIAVRRGDLSASIMMHIGFNLVTTLLAL
ncbi:MAG: protease family protein [Actinomycetota bacterium]|nr:protease family protein [Actinomycetota bacterium]